MHKLEGYDFNDMEKILFDEWIKDLELEFELAKIKYEREA